MVLYDVVYNAQPLSVSVYLSVIESVCLSVVPPISKGRARGSALALEVEHFVDTLERELYGGTGCTSRGACRGVKTEERPPRMDMESCAVCEHCEPVGSATHPSIESISTVILDWAWDTGGGREGPGGMCVCNFALVGGKSRGRGGQPQRPLQRDWIKCDWSI